MAAGRCARVYSSMCQRDACCVHYEAASRLSEAHFASYTVHGFFRAEVIVHN
jgi:hypothetical protein